MYDKIANVSAELQNLRAIVESSKKAVASKDKSGLEIKGCRQDSKDLKAILSRTEQIEGELMEFRAVMDSLTRNVEQIAEDLKQICKDVAEIRHKQPIIID